MHSLSPLFYMEKKFRPLEKKAKNDRHQTRWNFSEQPGTPFLTTKERSNFGKIECITSWRKTKKIQIKVAMTCNKNEQQQDAKNNAQL
jgi:hypothetical protein